MTAADLGMTRRQMFEMMRLAEVPDDEFERIIALPHKEMISAIRHIKSGQWRRGVFDNDAHVRLPRELFEVMAKVAKRRAKRGRSHSPVDRIALTRVLDGLNHDDVLPADAPPAAD